MTNEEYANARNRLIPMAEAHANREEGKRPQQWEGPHRFAKRWNLCFLSEMDRLARKEGLVPHEKLF